MSSNKWGYTIRRRPFFVPLNIFFAVNGYEIKYPEDCSKKESICDTAPYPECNGANGCDTCEHQPED